jgi:Domain of unknown function (DUF4913)
LAVEANDRSGDQVSDQPDDVQQLLAAVQAQQRAIEGLMLRLEKADPTAAVRDATKDGATKDGATKDDATAKAGNDTAERQRPIDWDRISGYERQQAWEKLAAFVEAMVHRHVLASVVMPCWWRHPDAVQNLTALWHIHEETYGDEGKPEAAMSYLDNLYKVLDRLRHIFMSCREEHIAPVTPKWQTDAGRREFREMVRADSSDRYSTPQGLN